MFKFSSDFKSSIWGENDEKIMQDFGDKLKSYSLFTFEERLFAKMLTFANTIGNGSSPSKLKELIKEISIDEENSDFGSYALSGTAKKSEITRTKFGHLTFNYFFYRLSSSSRPSQLSSSLRRQVWSAAKRLDTISLIDLLIMFDAHLG